MQLLHDDVVLEVRVAPEVETDPVAQFGILDGLNLRNNKQVHHQTCVCHRLVRCNLNSPDLKISHVTEGVFVRLVDVSREMRVVQ